MRNEAVRNILLVTIAIVVGAGLGAATKFGLGRDLAVASDDAGSLKPIATP
jgi:hypothetical protein